MEFIKEHDMLLAVARRRKDLIDPAWVGLRHQITEDPQADYRWRALMKRNDFKDLLSDNISRKLEYDSFRPARPANLPAGSKWIRWGPGRPGRSGLYSSRESSYFPP